MRSLLDSPIEHSPIGISLPSLGKSNNFNSKFKYLKSYYWEGPLELVRILLNSSKFRFQEEKNMQNTVVISFIVLFSFISSLVVVLSAPSSLSHEDCNNLTDCLRQLARHMTDVKNHLNKYFYTPSSGICNVRTQSVQMLLIKFNLRYVVYEYVILYVRMAYTLQE